MADTVLAILAVGLPLGFYILRALTAKAGVVEHPDQFFGGAQVLSADTFRSTSVAYGMQVATLLPFFYWGMNGWFTIAAANLVFWGFGIAIFRMATPHFRRLMASGLGVPSPCRTIPQYIERQFGPSDSIRSVTGTLTLIALGGIAIIELYWGAGVIAPLGSGLNKV